MHSIRELVGPTVRKSGTIGGHEVPGNRHAATVYACSPLNIISQDSLAVLIFTPGPMVEATTQLRIYWPLAAAGLALTMAPMRAL